MSENLERIISKIKKCLALSKSDNPGEAANALRQAQKLMREYGIDEVAMAGAEIGVADVEAKSTTASRPPAWEAWLLVLVGRAFGCRATATPGTRHADGRRDKAIYRFIGLTVHATTAAYTATVLLRQLRESRHQRVKQLRAEARSEGWKPTAEEERATGDAFCVGWLQTVEGLVVAFANPDSVEQAIQKRQYEATHGRVAKTGSLKYASYDQDAITDGVKAGESVRLHRGVSSSGAPKLALR